MKISELVNVMQKRASPRTSFARSLGYVCLILMALASRGAVAQTTVNVTLQPGEVGKIVQAPSAASFTVNYVTPEYFCEWPTTDTLKNRIVYGADHGLLQEALTRMESAGTGSRNAIGNALADFYGMQPNEGPYNGYFRGRNQQFTQQQLAAGPLTYVFKDRCLTVEEAAAAVNEIRRVIRTYLGLPAPTN